MITSRTTSISTLNRDEIRLSLGGWSSRSLPFAGFLDGFLDGVRGVLGGRWDVAGHGKRAEP
jgi:uncharacterized membrane protein YfcA